MKEIMLLMPDNIFDEEFLIGGTVMSKFYDDTIRGLLEAVAISKGKIPLVEKENMSAFTLKSARDIYAELEESRACYERGKYKDFDVALDEIRKKYGL